MPCDEDLGINHQGYLTAFPEEQKVKRQAINCGSKKECEILPGDHRRHRAVICSCRFYPLFGSKAFRTPSPMKVNNVREMLSSKAVGMIIQIAWRFFCP